MEMCSCGMIKEWVECSECGGEGVTHHECGEDTCCCRDPEQNVNCHVCIGMGGHYACPRCDSKQFEGFNFMRTAIHSFAHEMERVMADNDKEKGDSWKGVLPIFQLKYQLINEIEELKIELTDNDGDALKKELVDVANYCMMIWNRLVEVQR